jgi:RHS repeat-associated protein
MTQLDSGATTLVYDALGRRVEQTKSGSTTEILYGPSGGKLALMSGTALSKAFVPLPGGGAAVYGAAGLSNYRHPDWLGSSRLASTPSRGFYYDGAYAPFGENYAENGTADRSFTGQNQDMAGDLYDFFYREEHTVQGRWVSPDPAGRTAVDPANPQSWNRYAYLLGNPLGLVDPLGLGADCGGPCMPFSYVDSNGCLVTITYYSDSDGYDLPLIVTSCPGQGPRGSYGGASWGTGGVGGGGVGTGTTAPSKGRNCSVNPASGGQHAAASAQVAAPNTATSAVMGQSAGVQDVLNEYYILGRTNGLYSFGAVGYSQAGANPVAQFVGSFRWSISGGILSLTNTTSFKSLTYDIGPQWQRSSFGPMGNTHQTYQIGVTCHE